VVHRAGIATDQHLRVFKLYCLQISDELRVSATIGRARSSAVGARHGGFRRYEARLENVVGFRLCFLGIFDARQRGFSQLMKAHGNCGGTASGRQHHEAVIKQRNQTHDQKTNSYFHGRKYLLFARNVVITMVSSRDYVGKSDHHEDTELTENIFFCPWRIELMSLVVTLEEKLRRAKIDNVTSQQAIRRSKNLTLGSKQKIARASDGRPGKSASDKGAEFVRKLPLEQAAEIRRQAQEIRKKSQQVHAKSREVREALSQKRTTKFPPNL
jgi:hypothetical protein